jgi:3'-5' exonuclease
MQQPLQNYIIIDIETASTSPNYSQLATNEQELWSEKINRYVTPTESADELYTKRAGVFAEFSKIICIAIGYFANGDSTDFRTTCFYNHNEKIVLQEFIATLNKIEAYNNKWCFAGHNIKEFDIPFICRRLLINGLKIPVYLDFQQMKPWETNIFDTLQYWRFGDYKNYISLKLLAAVLGITTSKNNIDGSKVGPMYHEADPQLAEENFVKIAEYCKADVKVVADVILKLLG